MAYASESESEDDLFVGFGEEDREAVAAFRQARFEARHESEYLIFQMFLPWQLRICPTSLTQKKKFGM